MKQVVLEVPDSVDVSEIFYWNGWQYVRAKAVEKFPIQLNVTLSDKDIEEPEKLLKEGMRKSSVAPFGLMVSRKEFDALRSRMEKLEREAERQCARVIRMEESISDDLK